MPMKITNTLADLFGKSPIRPIQEHMVVAVSAADQLNDFISAVIAEDWQAAEVVYNNIRDIENDADELKKDLRLHLPKSLFLPVPRSDLLELLTRQDKIANSAKDIAGMMLGRKMVLPHSMHEDFSAFIGLTVAASQQALKAIGELSELLESGFRGRELDLVERIVDELDSLEGKADEREIIIRAHLFSIEASLSPVDVMFMYRAIESIGQLADRAERVGSHLIVLLAR